MEKNATYNDPMVPIATARRPLLGLTILLVEDSRFASEAVRLLCLRCGARLRRAGSLRAARQHLKSYRPAVVIVDLGLPDGSGLDIIAEIAAIGPPAPIILATSGEDPLICGPAALAAGSNGFLSKPLRSLQEFQETIIQHLPHAPKVDRANIIALQPDITPDKLALREDLGQISHLIREAVKTNDQGLLNYTAQFFHSVASGARDKDLAAASRALSARLSDGFQGRDLAGKAADLIDGRLNQALAV